MGFFKNLLRSLVVSYIGEAFGAGYSGSGVALAHKDKMSAVAILSDKKDFIFAKDDVSSVKTDERNIAITVQGKKCRGNKYSVYFKDGSTVTLYIKDSYCQSVEKVFA